jgi:hypothetical protein
MAGDWVPVRTDLEDDPTVVHMVTVLSRCCVTEPLRQWPVLVTRLVIGCLGKFWGIADGQTIDGFLAGYTPELMDAKIGLAGFTEALASAPEPWVVVEPNGLRIPKFGEFMGDSAKKRLQDRKRQRSHRTRDKSQPPGVTGVTPERDSSVTTEQYRTVQNKEEDETRRDDHLDLSSKKRATPADWEDVREFCRRKFAGGEKPVFPKPGPADREFLLKVGALCLDGLVAEALIDGALEAVRHHGGPLANPAAYFTSVLHDYCTEHGQALPRLLAKITIPQELTTPQRTPENAVTR